jgi:hypothetical protein
MRASGKVVMQTARVIFLLNETNASMITPIFKPSQTEMCFAISAHK